MLLFLPLVLILALSIHIIFAHQLHYSLAGFVTSTMLVFAYVFGGQRDIPAMLALKAIAPAAMFSLVLTISILAARALLASHLLVKVDFTETSS